MTPERRQKLSRVLDHRQPDLAVVLENVFDPHNISAVMRTCDSVGVQDVYVLTTKIPRHEKWGRRSSSSAHKWLTVHQFDNLGECMEALRQRYSRVYTTHLAVNSVGLYQLDLTQSVALVFGNEHSGCSDEVIAAADGNFIIPQVGIIQSLNISVACAVSLYEAFRQRQAAGHYRQPKLLGPQRRLLEESWGFDLLENEEI